MHRCMTVDTTNPQMRRPRALRGLWLSLVTGTLLTSAACKQTERDEQVQGGAQKQVEQAQRETEQAYDQAKESQAKARDKTEEAVDAEQEAVRKQREAAEAEAKAQQERQEAQQAQEQARQQGQQAQQTAQSAQERASQAQQQATTEAQTKAEQARTQTEAQTRAEQARTQTKMSGTIAEGIVESATADEIVIQRTGATSLRVKIDPDRTQFLKSGQPTTMTNISTGAKVRVWYRMDKDQPVAERIETTESQPTDPRPES